MESSDSDLSDADSLNLVIQDSQESPFIGTGEATQLANLPGLHMENVESSETRAFRDGQASGERIRDHSSDEEDHLRRTRPAVFVTDTGSEAEPNQIPANQTFPWIVSGRSSGKYRLGSGVECEPSHTHSPRITSKSRTTTTPARALDNKHVPSPKDIFSLQDSDDEEGDKNIVLTPSEHIGSLQLSQPQALVPETLNSQSQSHVPPSAEAYGSFPVIIPGSPTDMSSEKDSLDSENGGRYKPEELSTLDPDKKQRTVVKESNSGSASSSRSEKRSAESDSKSNGNSKESVQQWQPTVLSSAGDSGSPRSSLKETVESRKETDVKTPRKKFTVELEASELLHQRSSSSKFFPSLSEGNSDNSEHLQLRFSHTEEEKSNSEHQPEKNLSEPDSVSAGLEDESGFLDSQHVALRLSPSQPDSAARDVEIPVSRKFESTSQPFSSLTVRRKHRKVISSSDPLSGERRDKLHGSVSLFGPRLPLARDVSLSPEQKPLSSTPDSPDNSHQDIGVAVLKPSLSLSMIDLHDEEEDSSLQSFRLDRPVLKLPVTSDVPEGDSLFKKGISPQKKRKRPLLQESAEDDPFSFTPPSQRKSPAGKKLFVDSQQGGSELTQVPEADVTRQGGDTTGGSLSTSEAQFGGVIRQSEAVISQPSAHVSQSAGKVSQSIADKQEEAEDPDVTIPPESPPLKAVDKSVRMVMKEVAAGKREAGKRKETSISAEQDEDQEATAPYEVKTYTDIRDKSGELASLEEMASPKTDRSGSVRQRSKTSQQSSDLYDFHSTQSQIVGGAIKDPNTTPVTMPKNSAEVSGGKKRRKKTLVSTRRTRTSNRGSKILEEGNISSSEDLDKTDREKASRENIGFVKQAAELKRMTRLRQGQPMKTVRLSLGGKEEQPGMSTTTAVTPSRVPPTSSEAGSGGGSQSGVWWKTIVTTKTRLLYEKRQITIEKRKDGKVIYTETTEENDKPVEEWHCVTTHEEEMCVSPGISPSRSVSTVTSGDLGDVSSSLSRSGSHTSKTSSGSSLERMHSSLEKTGSIGTGGHGKAGGKGSNSKQSSPKRPALRSSHRPSLELKSKDQQGRDGSDVLFTSSDMDKSDSSKLGNKDMDISHMELSPIVDVEPLVVIPEIQAAGGKTPNVTMSPEVTSVSIRNPQVSGGFTVTEQALSSPEGGKSESDGIKQHAATAVKSRPTNSSYYDSSSSSKDLPLKKRKVVDPGEGVSTRKTASPRKGKAPPKPVSSGHTDDISPEIPLQAGGCQNLGLMDTNYTRVTAENVSFQSGSLVMARWKDGFYYPGSLIGPKANDRCMVDFADGDHLAVPFREVIIVDRFSIGQSVLVESSDGGYDPGLVIGYYGRGENMGYTVETDDAVTKKYSRSKVILSADQATCILGDDPVPSTSGPSRSANVANISLDNLVEGKRQSRKASLGEVTSAKKKGPEAKSSKTTGSGVKGSNVTGSGVKGSNKTETQVWSPYVSGSGKGSTKGKKRKFSAFEPSKTSTPTPTQSHRKRTTEKSPSPKRSRLGGAVDSPKTATRPTRRARIDLFEDAKGPLPQDKAMFKDMVFILTHVEKTPKQRRDEKLLLIESSFEGSTDESAIEDEVIVPFDKEHLKSQIQKGGGVVLDKFDLTKLFSGKECYVVSDCYQRTVKYLLSLAAGVTCVSHVWIRDSCKQGILLDPMAYVLPAGLNIDTKKIVECSKRTPLAGMSVCVVSLSSAFSEAWESILQTAGCVVTSQPSSEVNIDKSLDVVVSETIFPKSFQEKQAGVPIVSTEWVIQCLIRGQYLETNSHPRYQPGYQDS